MDIQTKKQKTHEKNVNKVEAIFPQNISNIKFLSP